ncbi:MAG TPA: preprotein translocase subunit YajC [Candidatus Tripitaka californicus]|uniref:preprotein translocase subunit YajC n=1 Tax=Candidatus Tripitaka californicus TaxID=3367616 RepID=UPI0040284057
MYRTGGTAPARILDDPAAHLHDGFCPLFLHPQAPERHRLDLLAGLKKNDRVITGGGLHGVVVSVKEKEVILQIDETKDVKVKVEKDAIISVEHREKHTESKEKHKEEG